MPDISLSQHRILLGVTGGIAAYKSAELVRLLRKAGAEVQVVLSAGGARFITPVTLQALSGHPVRQSLWDEDAEAAMGHIELARWPDCVVVAPASANAMARLAAGMTSDLLSTLCLASDRPLLLAPAMNRLMWAHPATRDNVERLRARGARVIGPAAGDQACGEVGDGRMVEPAELLSAIAQQLGALDQPLQGRRAVITAGPTREAIDPVRVLSNRSSGRMGFALADALARAGAEVTLVAGPVHLNTPDGVQRIDVESAADMAEAASRHAAQADLFIGCAAVADYRPAQTESQKIKKDNATLSIALERTQDILQRIRGEQPALYMVGFAAETENLADNARGKLERKGLQLVAGNLVGAGRGFDREDNHLILFSAEGETDLGRGSKRDLASRMVARIAQDLSTPQST
ncbi:bifunctional phosphopantothenoylcysteine decarboxylase/phosphopantothenate--cysteine ligase CoaBC [Algiphilus sp. NNCM1]|uniref:bifunctional phosphopantothenoylcysteine decarboxylase/phosphopantothenate--cysteine ligase CoaBC n=1 Tax=Algiphilus sp. TaxID=1872431 RepID=UPI001CA5F89A|nr:bifunctional phosphopantothenoylcysteine decarboxylase/phosphopantothenate--cysteine ligase CoaBC [Algiphilus sp.]MBY8966338.1 bifunctional phosphopantothenoylcysteine decarboxylase/phosphopantothenate--cysteine ligase CoaBC [Algiphilus acroporae]MCI5062265.1 bifunctional phosphopantothenoylcysteine decarboxylase/phosphopantothenate--cysteine ligase CoaBC [Algiphilus sp.]MCI5102201.1 bifunctional phosphopantothenoylcysteine decarboxylase/phosphopantothenate--cysteine ligase CoaBC [Algiphilus 